MTKNIFISKGEVMRQTSLSGPTIWRQINEGNFPKSVKISDGRVAWSQAQISLWIKEKLREVSNDKA